MRMQAAAEDHFLPARKAVRHHRRLGCRRRAIVERGVRHIHAGDERELGLVLEQRLQRALGDLGLIGRVRGQELAALHDVVDRGGNMMAIGAGAEEERNRPCRDVPRRELGQRTLDREFAHAARQVERAVEQRVLRNVAIEIVDTGRADRGKHGAAIVVGEREIAHHASPSTNFL